MPRSGLARPRLILFKLGDQAGLGHDGDALIPNLRREVRESSVQVA